MSFSLSKKSASQITKNNDRNGMIPFISGMEFVKSEQYPRQNRCFILSKEMASLMLYHIFSSKPEVDYKGPSQILQYNEELNSIY